MLDINRNQQLNSESLGLSRRGLKIETTDYCELRTIRKKNTHQGHWTAVKVFSVNHDQVNYLLNSHLRTFPSRRDDQLKEVNPFTIGKLLRSQQNDLWQFRDNTKYISDQQEQ